MVLYTSATNMSVILSRAYFKESLQLQRMEKFQTSKHFKISCQKKCFISQNFRRPFFSHLQKNFDFIHKKCWRPFFSHFLYFLWFSPSKRCRYYRIQQYCTNQLFASFILKMSRFSAFFYTLFHCSSSKFTTTSAQFPFYYCKLHFTTAQIVISCTLKYALILRIQRKRWIKKPIFSSTKESS